MKWTTGVLVGAAIVAAACTDSGITPPPPPAPPPPPPSSGTNHAPVANIAGSTSTVEGTALTFNATTSTDPDHDALQYSWNFGDGAGQDSGGVASHTYADNGSDIVRVVVSDPGGLADTATLTVAVSNAPPQITSVAVPTSAVALSDSVKIDAVTSDPGKADSLTVSFDWGDGKKNSGAKGHGAHKYAAAGHYTVKVTVTDDDSASASREAAVDVRQGPQPAGYEAIDLGTLGGESSRPYALNDNDAVVGASRTTTGELHAFLWKDGAMRDLATGSSQNRAEMITNGGLIAGVGLSDENTDVRALQWNNGVTTDFGSVGWGGGQTAITGLRATAMLAWRRSEMERYSSTIWLNGVKQQIGGVHSPNVPWPNSEAQATAMNDSRQVVGASLMHGGHSDIHHAFLWENGTTRDLGVLQEFSCDINGDYPYCGRSQAMDINDHGVVVGTSNDSTFHQHAVLWSDGVIHDLGPGVPLTINNAGDIAGNSIFDYGTNSGEAGHGYFWRNGARTDIGSLGGPTSVVGMNGQSTLVGTSIAADGRPHVFVWKPGQSKPTDLGTGPTETPGVGAIAVAINERGDVVGYSCDNYLASEGFCYLNAKTRAILWRLH